MKNFIVLFLSVLLVCALVACGGNTSNTDSTIADYPYQAEFDDNGDILILAKSKEALDDFINQSIQNDIDSAFSDYEEVHSSDSNDALIIEKAEFDNGNDADSFSNVYVTVRNNSGKSGTLLNLNIDFIDENGDIISSTYPQYGSILDDGQACRMNALYEGIPYGIRIASADITTLPNENIIDVKFESPFIAINPEN